MYDADQAEKHLESIANSIGTDVVGAFAKLHGISMKEAGNKVAEQVLELHEREQMSPEDRAKADAQTELERKAAAHDSLEQERTGERQAAAAKSQNKPTLSAYSSAGDPVRPPTALTYSADVGSSDMNGPLRSTVAGAVLTFTRPA